MFNIAVPAWFASQGLSAGQVGAFIAIVFLPWSFKLVAGPIMDKFTFPPMGRRRPWVIGAQTGLLLSFVLLGVISPDPVSQYYLLASLGFLCNAFGALQDVAVDGMAIDILKEDERAQANAYMYGGQIAGISGASAGGSLALTSFGLFAASMLMALAILLIMLVPIAFRERVGERTLPWSEGRPSPEALVGNGVSWRAIFVDLFRSLVLPMSILLIVVEGLSRSAGGVLITINPVIAVQELGWLQTDYSNWYAICGVIAAVTGIVIAPLIDRFGAYGALFLIIAFRTLMFLVVATMDASWHSVTFFKAFILINYVSGQIVTVSIIAMFMRLCFKQVAATQFAVYMASANLTLSLGAALVLPLEQVFDYVGMMYFVAGLNLAILVLLPLLNLERHDEALLRLAEQAR